MKFTGVFIAPVTPVTSRGQIDFRLWGDLIDDLLTAGIDGICVGGATSEYPHFDLGERKELISSAAEKLRNKGRFLVSVGASCYSRVLELGEHASEEGAESVLLPMPHFFHYDQIDLEHFCSEVANNLPLPCLIYNIPFFTNPLEVETIIRLLQGTADIVGIKDCSGSAEALTRLVEACRDSEEETSLLIGRDTHIYEGLVAGWDGCISGLGNLCPELVVRLYRSFWKGDLQTARACQEQIGRIAARIEKLPMPWGIRLGLEVRGFACGPPALPIAPERQRQVEDFRLWYGNWLASELPALANSTAQAAPPPA